MLATRRCGVNSPDLFGQQELHNAFQDISRRLLLIQANQSFTAMTPAAQPLQSAQHLAF